MHRAHVSLITLSLSGPRLNKRFYVCVAIITQGDLTSEDIEISGSMYGATEYN